MLVYTLINVVILITLGWIFLFKIPSVIECFMFWPNGPWHDTCLTKLPRYWSTFYWMEFCKCDFTLNRCGHVIIAIDCVASGSQIGTLKIKFSEWKWMRLNSSEVFRN